MISNLANVFIFEFLHQIHCKHNIFQQITSLLKKSTVSSKSHLQRERKVWTRDPIGKRETPSENNCNKYVSLQWHCPDANYERIKIIATMIAENENGTLYSVQNFDYSQWSEFWWYQLQWLFCWRFADRINLAVWFPIMVSIDWLTFGSLTWLIKLEYFVDHIKKCER